MEISETLKLALEATKKAEQLKKAAVEELLKQRKEIDSQLENLGYTETPPVIEKKRRTKNLYCKLCKVEGHDGRSHKSQSPRRAFTAEELANL